MEDRTCSVPSLHTTLSASEYSIDPSVLKENLVETTATIKKLQTTIDNLQEILELRNKRLQVVSEELESIKKQTSPNEEVHKQNRLILKKLQQSDDQNEESRHQISRLTLQLEEALRIKDAIQLLTLQNNSKDEEIKILKEKVEEKNSVITGLVVRCSEQEQLNGQLYSSLQQYKGRYGSSEEKRRAKKEEVTTFSDEMKAKIQTLETNNGALKLLCDKNSIQMLEKQQLIQQQQDQILHLKPLLDQEIQKSTTLTLQIQDLNGKLQKEANTNLQQQEDLRRMCELVVDGQKYIKILHEEKRLREAETSQLQSSLDLSLQNCKIYQEDIEKLYTRLSDAIAADKEQSRNRLMCEVRICQLKDQLKSEMSVQTASPISPPKKKVSEQEEMLRKKVQALEKSLSVAHEELAAQRDQVRIMTSEIQRAHRDFQMKLKIKEETINRLKNEPVSLTQDQGTDGDGDRDNDNANVDDLKSQISILRRELFSNIALNIKMTMIQRQFDSAHSININDLFEQLPQELPISEWPSWVEAQLHKRSKQISF